MIFVKVLDVELYALETFEPKHRGDAGIDLRSTQSVLVIPGQTTSIGLGVAIAIPSGYVGWLTGRSTTALKLGMHVAEGKIDSGYRGEIHAFVSAQGTAVKVERGDRIAQLVVVSIHAPNWIVAKELTTPDTRGEQGLGSTGLV